MAWYRCGGTPSEVLSLPTPSEASGAIARFNTDLTENLLSAVAEFSASQASGTPTPSTPIPIVGVDKVNFTRTGKNLLAKPIVYFSASLLDLSECFAVKSGTYTVSLGTISGATNWRLSIIMKDKNGNNLSDNEYKPNSNMSFVTSRWRWGGNSTSTSYSITIVKDCFVRFCVELGDTSSSTTLSNSQLEFGSTATTYEPYNGTTVLINLGGTYFGGEVDAVTGKITLTHKVAQITAVGDKNGTWDTEQGKGAFWYASSTQCPWLNDWDNSATNNGIKVDKYSLQPNTTTSTSTNAMSVFISKIIRWVDVDRMTMTKEDYNTYLASNPITILYPLATPVVVYASNTAEIPTIVGDNQVFADSGNVALKYFETVGHKI